MTNSNGTGRYGTPPTTDPLAVGWTKPAPAARRRLIVAVSGLEKQGKDHFALTAALSGYGPVYLHNFDYGLEGVVEKFMARGAEIYVKTYRMDPNWQRLPPDQKKLMAGKIYEEYQKFWADSVARGKGTIILDTHSEEWEIRRLAAFGKLSQVMPTNYTEVNNEFRADIREAYESGMNIILLQKKKKVYVGNNWNGQYEPAGYADLPFVVQANLEAFRNPNDNRFCVYVKDCRQNALLSGVTLDVHDQWDSYGRFMSLVFDGPAVVPGGNGAVAPGVSTVVAGAPTSPALPPTLTPTNPTPALDPALAELLKQTGAMS